MDYKRIYPQIPRENIFPLLNLKDDQIAVNRGWFELDENHQFCPEQIVTASEIDVMLADAQSTLKADEVDANYNSTYEIKKDED